MVAVVNGEERLYSQKLACPDCGASVPQLEPRSFSFNSPFGACEDLQRPGQQLELRSGKVIVDPSKPLLDGGLGPGASSSRTCTRRSPRRHRKLRIDLAKPFEDLSTRHAKLLLEGEQQFPRHPRDCCRRRSRTRGEGYREWFMEYMSPSTCPGVQGQAAEADQPGGAGERRTTIAELTAMSDRRAAAAREELETRRSASSRSRPAWWRRSATGWNF